MATSSWKCFLCSERELILSRTLACGQSFRWREMSPGVWTGIIGKKVWRLKQSPTHLFYQVFPDHSQTQEHTEMSKIKTENVDSFHSAKSQNIMQDVSVTLTKCKEANDKFKVKVEIPDHQYETGDKKGIKKHKYLKSPCTDITINVSDCKEEIDENESILHDYFQLNVCLNKLYNHWSSVDPNFKLVSSEYPGIRMIRQDPVECLFSFICSSNNTIPRITQMVSKLCRHYGEKIVTLDGEDYYSFPKISVLNENDVVSTLQNLGFGYRAKYIHESAKFILKNRSEDWLRSLRQEDYHHAKQQLMELYGVGAKVADCVCLMALDKTGVIPVDTHVWQIASQYYMPHLKGKKSVTKTLYDDIGKYFRDLWGEYAGWAHSVLFAADLKTIKVPKVTKSSSGKSTKRKTSEKLYNSKKIKQV